MAVLCSCTSLAVMDRRSFLTRSALLAAAVGVPGALAACGGGAGDTPGGATETGGAAAGAIPDGPAELSPAIATYELLTGEPQTLLFGLRDLDNVEIADAEVEVYLRDETGEKILAGPLPTEYLTAPGTGLGLYRVELDLDEPGNPELVAVEGDRYGAANLNVATPENATAPVPGQKATAVATPVEGEDLGYSSICTQDPPCGMHEISLDEALKQQRPVMLIFATPEFCKTVVCGPAVETVDGVRTGGEWGETAWIHVEIYSKFEGNAPTLGDPVQAWKLPSEPWLFSIGADGKITDRLDGPMVTQDIESMASGLTA